MRRRSANSLVEYLDLIGYVPRHITIGGVGGASANAQVFREVWPEVEIFGFEPDAKAYRIAKETFPGIIWNHALWSSVGSRPMYVKPGWLDGSSMFQSREDQAQRIEKEVSCVVLDGFFKEPGPGGVLWLDCEGAELEILKGAENFIQNIDVVNVELTSVPRGAEWAKPREVHAWLQRHGFRQMFIHSIRPCIGQRDVIYGRGAAYHYDYTHFLEQ